MAFGRKQVRFECIMSRSYSCSDSMSVKVFFLNPRVGDNGGEVPDDFKIKNEFGLTLQDHSNLAAIPLDFFLFGIT